MHIETWCSNVRGLTGPSLFPLDRKHPIFALPQVRRYFFRRYF